MAVVALPPNVECIIEVNTILLGATFSPSMVVSIKEEGESELFKRFGDPFHLPRGTVIHIRLPLKTKQFFVDLTVPGQGGAPVANAIRKPEAWQSWEASRDPMFVIVWEDDDLNAPDAFLDNDIVAAIQCPKKT